MANEEGPGGPVFSSNDEAPQSPARRGWIGGLIGAIIAGIVGIFAWSKFAASNTASNVGFVPGQASTGERVALGQEVKFLQLPAPINVTIQGHPAFVDFHKSRTVLSAICPHAGCTVNWDPAKRQYICPCHGSAFSEYGSVEKGPAAQPLRSYQVDVQDGIVYAQT